MRFRKRLLAIGAIIAICLLAGAGVAGKEAGIPAATGESGGGAVVGAGGAAATGASRGVKAADGGDTRVADAESEDKDGEDKDVGSGEELPDLPEESLKPEVDETGSETGAGVEQKELAERSGKTGASRLLCDGQDCPYSKDTLPGSRDFNGSSFPISQFKETKELLEHLVDRLGKPCPQHCALVPHRSHEECMSSCRGRKIERARELIARMNKVREENAQAIVDDRNQTLNPGPPRYSNPTSAVGTLEGSPNTYEDLNELDCSISTRTREVCGMCGGERAYRFKGYRVEVMSPREQRFVAVYPFSKRRQQEDARKLLKELTPDSINTMSLSVGGDIACISSNPPATVYDALMSLGYNVTGKELMRGMPRADELQNKNVMSIRIDSRGRGDIISRGGGSAGGLVKSVVVSWADSRVAWDAVTDIVPFMQLRDAIGEIEVRDAYTRAASAQLYINGSIMFGGGLEVPVVAHQVRGRRFGSLTGAIPGDEVSISQILMGFGCGDARLEGEAIERCDPLPVGSNLVDHLKAVGLDKISLRRARMASTYDTQGQGRAFYRVEGIPRGIDDATGVAFASFSRCSAGCLPTMNFVYGLSFKPGSATTLKGLIALASGGLASERLGNLSFSSLSLIISKTDVDLGDAPFLLPISDSLDAGVTIRCDVSFASRNATALDRLVASLLPRNGVAPIHLQGSVTASKTQLSGPGGDLELSPGTQMADATLVVTAGYVQGCPECDKSLDVEFHGEVLIPRGRIESITLKGFLKLMIPSTSSSLASPSSSTSPATAAKRRSGPPKHTMLLLEASVAGTLYNAFGVPNMHLAYGVVRQPVRGGPVAWYGLDAVLSLGASCSADNIDIPNACDVGTSTAAMSPVSAREDVMVGVLPIASLTRLFEFAGVDCGSSCDILGNLTLPIGAIVSYAPRPHAFTPPSSSPRVTTGMPASIYRIPVGFSGMGQAEVYGVKSGQAAWTADLSKGEMLVNVDLERMLAGGLNLTGVESGQVGPTMGVRGVAGGEGVSCFMQAHVSLWGLEKYAYAPIVGTEASLAVFGRFGQGGILATVRARARVGNWTVWQAEGEISGAGMEEMRHRWMHDAVVAECKSHKMTHCERDTPSWTSAVMLCSVSFKARLAPMEPSTRGVLPAAAEYSFNGNVYTANVNVDVGSSSVTALELAKPLYSLAKGASKSWPAGMIRRGGCKSPTLQADNRPPRWRRTVSAAELPTPDVMKDAMLEANDDAWTKVYSGDEWSKRQKVVASARHEALSDVWQRERRAHDIDEMVMASAVSGYQASKFAQPRPGMDAKYSGLLTDSLPDLTARKATAKTAASSAAESLRMAAIAKRLSADRSRMVDAASRDVGSMERELESPIADAADAATRGETKEVDALGRLVKGAGGGGGGNVFGGNGGRDVYGEDGGPVHVRGRGDDEVGASRGRGRRRRIGRRLDVGVQGGGEGRARYQDDDRHARAMERVRRSRRIIRTRDGRGGVGQGAVMERMASLQREMKRLKGVDSLAKGLERDSGSVRVDEMGHGAREGGTGRVMGKIERERNELKKGVEGLIEDAV